MKYEQTPLDIKIKLENLVQVSATEMEISGSVLEKKKRPLKTCIVI